MCNMYSQTKSQDAMRHVFDDMRGDGEELVDLTGNLPLPGIFPAGIGHPHGLVGYY